MNVKQLEVVNFRALKHAVLTDLPKMIVIAGPNGCGKSALFDALRLLKSAYGGYQPNEWQHWFGEHQINLDRNQPELLSLFHDRAKPISIQAIIELEQSEVDYVRENGRDLVRPLIWEHYTRSDKYRNHRRPVADQIRRHGSDVERETESEMEALREDLSQNAFIGELTIEPNLGIRIAPSPMLQLVFTLFLPERIGIMDYHSAQRIYNREQVGGINLSIESTEQQYRQHALYNDAAKISKY